MEWESVLIEWVNSLRLTDHPIESIGDLSDSKFFCELHQIRNKKAFNVRDGHEIFQELKKTLEEKYFPGTWIDFKGVAKGDERELIRLLSVLMAACSLEDQNDMFRENPAAYLSSAAQKEMAKFLQLVLQNSRVVTEELFKEMSVDKENVRPLLHCSNQFTKKSFSSLSRKIPESPRMDDVAVSLSHTPVTHHQRESTEVDQCHKEILEKQNSELLAKSAIISELETRNSELASKLDSKSNEIKILSEKNQLFKDRVDELDKCLDGLTTELQVKTDLLKEMSDNLTEIKSLLAKSDNENEKLSQENISIKKERDALSDSTQTFQDELNQLFQSQTTRIEELNQIIEQKTRILEEVQEENEVLVSKCASLHASLESSKNSLEEAKTTLEKSEEEFSASLNRLCKDLEQERNRVAEGEEKLAETELILSESQNENEKLRIEGLAMKDELLAKSVIITELKSGKRDYSTSMEDTSNEIMSAKNLHLNSWIEELDKCLEGLTMQLQVKSNQLKETLDKLDEVNSLLTKSKAENKKLAQENMPPAREKDADSTPAQLLLTWKTHGLLVLIIIILLLLKSIYDETIRNSMFIMGAGNHFQYYGQLNHDSLPII